VKPPETAAEWRAFAAKCVCADDLQIAPNRRSSRSPNGIAFTVPFEWQQNGSVVRKHLFGESATQRDASGIINLAVDWMAREMRDHFTATQRGDVTGPAEVSQ
jgi:hypothetical protein